LPSGASSASRFFAGQRHGFQRSRARVEVCPSFAGVRASHPRTIAFRFPFALRAAGLAVASGTAVAQTQQIIVEAPRIRHTGERAAATGTPIDVISVTPRVGDTDLDIATASGATVREQRISDAAKAACKAIDRLHPLALPAQSLPPCEETAFGKSMVPARAAVAAAEKAPRKSLRRVARPDDARDAAGVFVQGQRGPPAALRVHDPPRWPRGQPGSWRPTAAWLHSHLRQEHRRSPRSQ
jgi:hypothetical protein